MTPLGEIIEEGKKRHAALTKIGKPYQKLFASLSFGYTIYRFFRGSGQFTFTFLGFAALTLFLVYYATSVYGLKLFARRALALLIDFSLLGFVLFVFISLYEMDLKEPGDTLQIQLGKVLMLALWLAFLYFVIFDWWFKGTLGKRFLGLKVVPSRADEDVSFCRSFIRTSLCLILPAIGGVYLNRWIVGEGQSAIRWFAGDAAKNAFVSFIPISIMFLEGNQSISDRLLRIAVRADHEPLHVVPKITLKTWLLLCFSWLSWSLLLASVLYIAVFKPGVFGPSKLPEGAVEGLWNKYDPQSEATLWTILSEGLKEPTFGIRKIEFLEASPNRFSFQQEKSHFRQPLNLNPEPYIKMANKMPIVRVTLTRDRPLQVKLAVVDNFVTFVGRQTPKERRPAFAILQVATENNFGLFSENQQDNILACWMISGNQFVDFYTDVQPNGAMQFPISLDVTTYLLVGAGVPY